MPSFNLALSKISARDGRGDDKARTRMVDELITQPEEGREYAGWQWEAQYMSHHITQRWRHREPCTLPSSNTFAHTTSSGFLQSVSQEADI